MTERRLAIIGGGASAALLMAHLAHRKNAASLSVDIYDRGGRFARGIAYSTPFDGHLLNVRAGNMSGFYDAKDDFAEWAEGKGYAREDFAPRTLYGAYLAQRLVEAERTIPTRRIAQDVLSATRHGERYVLHTAGGEETYDYAVLASGNVRPLRPATDGAVEGYYDDPWLVDFAKVAKADRIILIGSGLTAVDTVLQLEANGHQGLITIVSRNALLPTVHSPPASYPDFLEEGATIAPLNMLALVRDHAAEAAAQGLPWQAVIDALRWHTNSLWQEWDAGQRRQFTKRLMTFWNVHRHRMAPDIATKIAKLQQSGRLVLRKAAVESVVPGPKVRTAREDIAADAVINCLGYRYDEEGRDFAVSHRIGPAQFGELFETTAIPEIRVQAHALAEEILP